MNEHDRWVAGVKCQVTKPVLWSPACQPSFSGAATAAAAAAARGWVSARDADWSGTRIAAGVPRSPFVITVAPIHKPVNATVRRASVRPHLESSSRVKARTMDATIYQIIFGELGDLNCSLIDAFQDTFLENASLSFLSTDGEMKQFLFYV